MKVRNLLLGSIALAGLSATGAYAADLGVLTSLDVCDSLGLSGLTISSDTNCLQITGEVRYNFNWGDYDLSNVGVVTQAGTFSQPEGDDYNDWESRLRAWVKFTATADSDFGPAKAVIKIKDEQRTRVTDEGNTSVHFTTAVKADSDWAFFDEAYVAIGDSTVIMAGKKGSVFNDGDDAPLNWLGLFNSEKVDVGVANYADDNGTLSNLIKIGGHVIQVTSDLGNGISVSGGLENLDDATATRAGTAVGVIAYKGDGIAAHASFAAGGILDGDVEAWATHAGFTGTFDAFKVVLAGAYGSIDGGNDYWNVLASASATFDMFTLAGSFEAANDSADNTDYGVGASASFAVSDGVTVNVGGRFYHDDSLSADGYQVAASVSAAVTETITLTGEVGYLNDDYGVTDDLYYGSAKLAWAPGGGYTSSVKGTVTSEDGYKIESEFKKTFE